MRSRIAIALLAVFYTTSVFAGPEEDYKAAVESYVQRGDIVTAMLLVKRAADAGLAKAQAFYGFILDQSEDNEEAVKYLRMAVAQGHAEGQFNLAKMIGGGEGVTAADLPEALRLYKLAAEQKHAQAILVVARAYIKGGFGLSEADKASPEALKWIKQGAELKDIESMRRLALAFLNGEFGLPVDVAAAAKLTQEIDELTSIKKDPKKRRRQ